MSKYIFMTEFNISRVHGGGLTCLRVFADKLFLFDQYVSLNFEDKNYPLMHEIKDRNFALPPLFPYPEFPSKKNLRYFIWKLKQLLNSFIPLQGFEDYETYSKNVSAYFTSNSFYLDGNYLFVPQGNLCIDIANNLHKKSNIKYLTWMMDDHLLRFKNGKWKYPRGYEAKLKYHLKNAYKVITISPSMADFYKKRFNIESEVLFGGAEFYNETILKNSNEIKLAYFGSLHQWQIESLTFLFPCLEKYDIEIHIYSYQSPLPEYLKHDRIIYKGSVDGDKVIEKMKQYHGILLPLSFRDQYRHMVELNIATKMSECIASGAIPVVVGPTYSAMIDFINKRKLGIVISSGKDLDMLEKLKNVEFQKAISLNTRKCFTEEISNKVMQGKWNVLWESFINSTSIIKSKL